MNENELAKKLYHFVNPDLRGRTPWEKVVGKGAYLELAREIIKSVCQAIAEPIRAKWKNDAWMNMTTMHLTRIVIPPEWVSDLLKGKIPHGEVPKPAPRLAVYVFIGNGTTFTTKAHSWEEARKNLEEIGLDTSKLREGGTA